VDDNTGKLSVAAAPASNLYIQKAQESGEVIRLEKYGFLQGEYAMDCYGVYAQGGTVSESARAAVQKAWEDASKSASWNDVKPPAELTAPTEAELNKKLDDFKNAFVNNAKAGLAALSTTGADYNVGVDVMSANIQCTGSITIKETKEAVITGLKCPNEVYVKFEVTNIKDGQEFPVYDGQKVVMSPMTLVFVGKFVVS
jgi:hypothetical protein